MDTQVKRGKDAARKTAATNDRNFRTFLLVSQLESEAIGRRIHQARKEAGKGRFVKEYGQFKFATFRCELEDSNYDRIGFVTVKTTGPESWKPSGFVPPRCPR